MSRLTEQIIDKDTGRVTGYKPIGNRNAFQICNRLGKYEDAEEQGQLIRLPCEFGKPMDEQKAIKELRERIDLINSDYPEMADYKEALEMAVAALGKQKLQRGDKQ